MVHQNHEDEKKSSDFFAVGEVHQQVEGRLTPPFEVRLSASLLLVEVLTNLSDLAIEKGGTATLRLCRGGPFDIQIWEIWDITDNPGVANGGSSTAVFRIRSNRHGLRLIGG